MCSVWLDYGIRCQSGSISVTIAISWRGGARGKCLWQSAGSCSIQLPFVAVIAVPTLAECGICGIAASHRMHGEFPIRFRRMCFAELSCIMHTQHTRTHAHYTRTTTRRRHDDPKQAFDYVRRIEDDASEDVSSTIIIMDAAPTLSATSSSDVAGVSAAAPLSSNRATPLPVLVRWKSQMSHGCHIHHLCMYTYLQPPSFHEQ